MFRKKGILKTFAKFHRKTPVLESLFHKVACLIKRPEAPTQVFSYESFKNLKNICLVGLGRDCRRPQNELVCLLQNADFYKTVPEAADLIFVELIY